MLRKEQAVFKPESSAIDKLTQILEKSVEHNQTVSINFTSVRFNDKVMEKQWINKENQDNTIRDNETTDFPIQIRMLDNVGRMRKEFTQQKWVRCGKLHAFQD